MSGIEGLGPVGGGIRSLRDVEPQRGITLHPATGDSPKADFAATLKDVLGEVNDIQLRAGEAIEQFASGETKDLHQVVIAQQEAAIAFQLIQGVRDKLLQGYQEIMRMQV